MSATERTHVERFRTLVAERLGLGFDDTRLDFLDEVLRRRLAVAPGLADAGAYLDRLASGSAAGELRELAGELTVAETYFFRNRDQLRALAEVVLPARLTACTPRRGLRCLSAGCATGEEAYSIAMILSQHVTDLASAGLEIRAVDVNPAVLERARRGHYTAWSLRETDAAAQRRWFEPDAGGFELAASVRAMVTFHESNLADDDPATWQPERYDVVFCRNVLMYFTPAHAAALIGRIARSLVPGGYLFLGHAETLRGLSSAFHLHHTHGAFYYQRKHPDERASAPPGTAARRPGTTTLPPEAGALASLVDQTGSWVEVVQRASERIQALASTAPATPAATAAAPHPAARGALHRALELHQRERYADALALVEALPGELGRDAEVLLLRAVLLTDGGRLAEAESACQELLRVDELSAGAHYLLALCREGVGDRRRAIEHDQTAVYLDPGFAMPHLHLGLLSLRAGDALAARRELGEALHLLAREDPARLLLLGGGFKRDALVALCRAQLRACGGDA